MLKVEELKGVDDCLKHVAKVVYQDCDAIEIKEGIITEWDIYCEYKDQIENNDYSSMMNYLKQHHKEEYKLMKYMLKGIEKFLRV